jgi:hypothetical protein
VNVAPCKWVCPGGFLGGSVWIPGREWCKGKTQYSFLTLSGQLCPFKVGIGSSGFSQAYVFLVGTSVCFSDVLDNYSTMREWTVTGAGEGNTRQKVQSSIAVITLFSSVERSQEVGYG